MKVLIAEDDPVTLDMTTSLVQAWGYDVLTARDGGEAWRILQQDNSPVILISHPFYIKNFWFINGN